MLFPVLAHALFTARVVRTCSSRNAWASPMNSNQSGLVIEANQPNVTAVDFFFEKSSKLSLIVWPAFYDFDDHFECVCACVFCLHTLLQHASESKLWNWKNDRNLKNFIPIIYFIKLTIGQRRASAFDIYRVEPRMNKSIGLLDYLCDHLVKTPFALSTGNSSTRAYISFSCKTRCVFGLFDKT